MGIQDDLIEKLQDNTDRLNGWEYNFIQNIDEQNKIGGLTDNQYDKLCEIFDRVMNK